jgi:hypothetical protein
MLENIAPQMSCSWVRLTSTDYISEENHNRYSKLTWPRAKKLLNIGKGFINDKDIFGQQSF